MKKLYFKSAISNLVSGRNSSLVSLIGLVIAFTAVLFIYSIISFENSYDSHHQKANRIYRISGDIITSENTMTHATIGPLLGPELKNEFPAVESFVRLIPSRHSVKLEVDQEVFHVDEAYTTEASVFEIFDFRFIYGSPKQALSDVNEIVINESLSYKMFGHINPLGQTIVRDGRPLKVAGVVADSPGNAHHKLNVLFAMGNRFRNREGISDMQVSEAYWMPSCYLFVLLKQNSSIESITDNFGSFYDKYMAIFGKHLNARFAPVAIPLQDVHFSRSMSYDYPKGSRTYSYLFIAVGLFIMLIALINYTNLLVAQNVVHSKSIGIRKINGASQLSIYLFYFFNSFVIIFVALVAAVVLYHTVIPLLSSRLQLPIQPISQIVMGLIVVGLSLVLSLTTALIPFFNQIKQSGLRLVQKKVTPEMNRGQLYFGSVSTIAQLSLSMVLLISVMLIGKQLTYLVESNMGFDKENVLLLKLNKTICKPETVNSLKQELLKEANIESVAFSRYAPGEVLSSMHFQMDRDGKTVTKIINGMEIDYDYISLMKMELADGRNFSPNYTDVGQSVIVNEAAIRFCGLTPPVVGLEIADVKVVGVLKDVTFNSLHNQTEPLLLYLDEQNEGYLNIRFPANADVTTVIATVEKSWQSFFSDEPVNLQFLDKRIEMMYNDDYAKGQLINVFTLISLLLSLMGLVNISILKTNQRTKEIGIRKVNGAKIGEILTLLNKSFIKWIVIAFVIACPIAWYAMHKWLENFAYKTEISWWIFALAGILTVVIALLTVSWQSWRAARRNPVEALRYE